ncbi:MAG: glutamate racemase [Candidatus Zixiibacteriota bacterium]
MGKKASQRKSANGGIGVFDSGVGGLTVVKEIFKILPQEKVIYFGDTARCPYGPRSKRIIQEFSVQNVNFLLSLGVKFIVVACNTSSAVALDHLKRGFDLPLMGVIEPGAKAAVNSTRNGKIGVIGTSGTIASGSYHKAIKKISKKLSVFSYACPLFVSLAEEGFLDKKATHLIAREYLKPLKKHGIDTLILGCTHYPLLKKVIARVMGDGVTLINSAEETAIELKESLLKEGLLNQTSKASVHRFFVSDQPEKFIQVGQRFLGKKIRKAQLVDINRY